MTPRREGAATKSASAPRPQPFVFNFQPENELLPPARAVSQEPCFSRRIDRHAPRNSRFTRTKLPGVRRPRRSLTVAHDLANAAMVELTPAQNFCPGMPGGFWIPDYRVCRCMKTRSLLSQEIAPPRFSAQTAIRLRLLAPLSSGSGTISRPRVTRGAKTCFDLEEEGAGDALSRRSARPNFLRQQRFAFSYNGKRVIWNPEAARHSRTEILRRRQFNHSGVRQVVRDSQATAWPADSRELRSSEARIFAERGDQFFARNMALAKLHAPGGRSHSPAEN